jgi:hypothetical protein
MAEKKSSGYVRPPRLNQKPRPGYIPPVLSQSVSFTAFIPKETAQLVDLILQQQGKSRSQFIKNAVEEMLKRHGKSYRPLPDMRRKEAKHAAEHK